MFLLSIIIPVYNAERTIARTLNSLNKLCSESKGVTQVVIVNDGTTDASISIAREMQPALSSLTLAIVEQDNQGLASARNTGLHHATGEWIFLLDADDELAFDPVPLIRDNPGASALAFSIEYHKDSKRKKLKHPASVNLKNHLDIFTTHNALTVSSIIFKRQHVRSFFDTALFSLEDWHFWMMNPLIFEDVKILAEVTLAIIHLHETNMSANAGKMGVYRQRVAENIIESFNNRLTRKQRNNLLIQARIGMIQQGLRMPLKAFLPFPCSIELYTRFIIYFLLREKTAKFGFYGN